MKPATARHRSRVRLEVTLGLGLALRSAASRSTMTRTTNARLAGLLFLFFYIATGMASMVLFGQATSGAEATAATLTSIAQHTTLVRLTAVLSVLTFVDAVVVAVAR
jgi:hypothetical protein